MNSENQVWWEVKCEVPGQPYPYCSSIIEAASAEEAVQRFYAESGVAGYAEPVEVNRIGLSSFIEAILSRTEVRSPR